MGYRFERTVDGSLCAILVLAAVWTLSSHWSPGGNQTFKVGVNTVGVTNDAFGARHATFVLTNAGRQPVLLFPTYGFENRSGIWRSNWIPRTAAVVGTNLSGTLPGTGKQLKPGETHTMTLILPFDDASWRAQFTYLEVWPHLASAIDDALRLARFPRTNNHNRPVQTYTDWK